MRKLIILLFLLFLSASDICFTNEIIVTPFIEPPLLVGYPDYDTIAIGEPFFVKIHMDNQSEIDLAGPQCNFQLYGTASGVQHWNVMSLGGISATYVTNDLDSLYDYSILIGLYS